MSDDRSDLARVVAQEVADGMTVYLGNFGAQLFCVGHELIRQQRRELDLVITSGGLLLDQLIGAGVAASAAFAHCWSPVGPAPAWNFRRLSEAGELTVRLHEMTLGLLNAALHAGAQGLPFQPVRELPDTGFFTEDWTGGLLAKASSPFGDSWVVQAISPDIAFVHVDLVDELGNGVIRSPLGETVLAAQAARRVVLVAEEQASVETVLAAGITIPGLLADAVVTRPGAVRPDGAIGRYDRDVTAYQRYSELTRTSAGFADWMSELVATTPNRSDGAR